MSEPCCATCVYWRRGAPTLAKAAIDPSAADGTGACEHNPPAIVPAHAFGGALAYFPITHESRACGMWNPIDVGDGGAREDIPNDTVINLSDRRAA